MTDLQTWILLAVGGLVAGIHSLTSAAAERPVRRVILISDGLANVGPSTPMELGNAAQLEGKTLEYCLAVSPLIFGAI